MDHHFYHWIRFLTNCNPLDLVQESSKNKTSAQLQTTSLGMRQEVTILEIGKYPFTLYQCLCTQLHRFAFSNISLCFFTVEKPQ